MGCLMADPHDTADDDAVVVDVDAVVPLVCLVTGPGETCRGHRDTSHRSHNHRKSSHHSY